MKSTLQGEVAKEPPAFGSEEWMEREHQAIGELIIKDSLNKPGHVEIRPVTIRRYGSNSHSFGKFPK